MIRNRRGRSKRPSSAAEKESTKILKPSTTQDKSSPQKKGKRSRVSKNFSSEDGSGSKQSTENESLDPAALRFLILNTTEPLVLRGLLDWEILNWDSKKWEEVVQNEDLEFRCGKNCYTQIPQWETKTKIKKGKFSDIMKYSSSDSEEWIYFDYKYLKHNFLELNELRDSIRWDSFGLNTVSVDDCALWIGSKGAHTSLHLDTYGCNIISQVYGRKLWVLFPPGTDLNETRVPYEESSIFSKYNLFSPDVSSMKDIKNCRKLILNPGEVLVLPWRWWHYVENLEPAISINAWIPLPQDDDQRLKESIVQMLMIRMTNNLSEGDQRCIINPNMMSNMTEDSPLGAFQIIDRCKDICLRNNNVFDDDILTNPNMNIKDLVKNHSGIEAVPALTRKDFIRFLEEQAKRFPKGSEIQEGDHLRSVINIINGVTHSDVILLIQEKLLLET